MEWYWWVLIVVAVAGLGYLKIKIWNHMLEKRKKAKQETEED